jgi:hypothetical protein
VTAVANSAYRHGRSFRQGSVYLNAAWRSYWNVGCPIMLIVYLQSCSQRNLSSNGGICGRPRNFMKVCVLDEMWAGECSGDSCLPAR